MGLLRPHKYPGKAVNHRRGNFLETSEQSSSTSCLSNGYTMLKRFEQQKKKRSLTGDEGKRRGGGEGSLRVVSWARQ